MLLMNSKLLDYGLDGASRLNLLDRLQEKSLTPLIRSSRLHGFGQALQREDRAHDLELLIADWHDSNGEAPYIRGDVICLEDHVLYLIFGDSGDGKPGITAGIIYETDATEPIRKLDSFCQTVEEALEAMQRKPYGGNDSAQERLEWHFAPTSGQRGLDRLIAKMDRDALSVSLRRESALARIRAAEFLDDTKARHYLKRAYEVFNEGSSTLLLSGETASMGDVSVEEMLGAGLLQREVLVSCRRTGHTLFRLPSADALAIVTVSEASCSECGTLIADEKVEDSYTPTSLATALLEDGSWLVTRIHAVLRELGLPESEIAVAPPTIDGNAHIMANVCGESFLFVLRDGDLTPAFARHAVDLSLETEATHLVVAATGKIRNEARVRLHEYARRRARGGNEIRVLILQGAGAVGDELRQAFKRVSQEVIATQLCELDADAGFNLSHMVSMRSQLLRKANLALVASL